MICPKENYKKRKNNRKLNQKEHKAMEMSDIEC